MSRMPIHKYRPFPPIELPDRTWPSRVISQAPLWCSVDLRDGNQALIDPMGPDRKLRMYDELVRMGFREIEVGFPAASQPDFDFVRLLIEERRIPDHVTIQVLVQARDELIERTFEALRGAPRAIVHLYNSTSPLQRRVVFGLEKPGIVEIARRGTRLIRQLAAEAPGSDIRLEYSPESFTATELEFAKEICEAVLEEWGATPERKVILNLPATVEVATPNVYADQIEWFGRHIARRESVILSVHPHNDRGTAVAAAELAMMAGAERVEGTLFGNGERTGNVDVVTLALNMLTQGVDPELEIHDVGALKELAEFCNRLPVHCRHPYAGELVFTAFSGSHQDAIKKGLAALKDSTTGLWEVPYLPIDPSDVGRTYEAIIRINSQSGKGGVAYVLEQDGGFELPRQLQVEFSRHIQDLAEQIGSELSPAQITEAFRREYLESQGPFEFAEYRPGAQGGNDPWTGATVIRYQNTPYRLECTATGPIDGFVRGLRAALGLEVEVAHYSEHALTRGAESAAVAYIQLLTQDGVSRFGVGQHPHIVVASLKALVSALNGLSRLAERPLVTRPGAPATAAARSAVTSSAS